MFEIASFVNFAIVVIVLTKLLRRPAKEFMRSRSEGIRNFIAEAEKEFSNAEAERTKWQTKWENAETEAKEHQAGAQESVVKLKERTLEEARQQAKRISEDGKLLGGSEVKKARRQIQEEVVTLSVGAAATHLKVELGESEKKSLITEYLERVSG